MYPSKIKSPKENGFYFFPFKPIKLLNKYERWRKMAKMLKLSSKAHLHLEWIIFYETKAQKNAQFTARHFGISRKTFYKWYNRFDETNLWTLEDRSKTPIHTREREITSLQEQRIIKVRKDHMYWGKEKLALIYKEKFQEKMSPWHIQKVIEEKKLYPNPKKAAKIRRKRKRAQKKKRITELKKKKVSGFLVCFDVIVIYWNGLKRYIFTAIDRASKIAFAHMYATKSSYNARDFLLRLHFLLEAKIKNAGVDNGTEWEKYFRQTCQKLAIELYHNRPYTPKDNPVNERFNQTLEREFIQGGNFTPNLQEFNKNLTEWLIEYNFVRPHQALGNIPPIKFQNKYLKVLPMYPSSTTT